MATLHVRNVPDVLYERLRDCAHANGRSIGAEVIVLLERFTIADLGRPRRTGGRARRRRSVPFIQRFNRQARAALFASRQEAVETGGEAVGTEHLLLGLLQARPTAASLLLTEAGLDVSDLRARIQPAATEAPAQIERDGEKMPFTPDAKKALELALRESMSLRAIEIGPEHLLLGIARTTESAGAQILEAAGLGWRTIRRTLRELDAELSGSAQRRSMQHYRVVELEGADDLEGALNALALEGYELLDIVDRRAIFRGPGVPV
jgi:Clp amino terminal domain, pathogenicity island component